MYCQGAHDSMSKAHSPRHFDAQTSIWVSGVLRILPRGILMRVILYIHFMHFWLI